MAAPAIPSHAQLYWPVLKALQGLGGSGTIREIEEKVAELEGFTEEQLNVPHGKGPGAEINYRLAWVRTYLKAAGALENSTRGVWSITDESRRLTEADMPGVISRARRTVEDARRARPADTVAEALGESEEQATGGWKDQLLDAVQSMPPEGFERLAQRLLREAGFVTVEVTGRSGDGGIDGVGVLRVSLLSFPVFFQCKRYRGTVRAGAVRDFRGAMVGRGDKGILITTGTFTRDARMEAARPGTPPIDLIDGEQLCDLLKDYRLGVSVERVETEDVTITSEWFADV